MGNFNFYKKNTVLNNILKNYSVVFSNSNYLLENYGSVNKELYSVSNEFEEQYIDNINLEIPEYNNKSLFEILTSNFYDYYTANINNLSKQNIINNIKRYNSSNSYINSSKYLDDNSFILDYSNKSYSLYYTTNNNLSLLSYNISLKNGFNYDNTNHVIYFKIDNEYIKNIHNILYFNYNKINNTDINNYGIFSFDKDYIICDNKNNLILNSDFKFNIQSNIKKLKKLYDDSTHIYKKLDFYYNNEKYQDNLNINNSNKDEIYTISYTTSTTPMAITIHKNNVVPFMDDYGKIKYKTNFIKSLNYDNNLYNDVRIAGESNIIVNKSINNSYLFFIKDENQITSYDITYVSYEFLIKYTDSNLYYTDNNYRINDLNIKDNNTIYTKNINQVSLKILNNIDNINYDNISNFSNKSFIKHYNKNSIDLKLSYNNHIITYTNLNLKIDQSNNIDIIDRDLGDLDIDNSFVLEGGAQLNNESNNHLANNTILDYATKISYKVCDSSSYTFNINTNIDNVMFCNSGITIEYKESPYLTNVDSNGTIIDYGEGELIYNDADKYILKNIHYKKYYQTIYIPLKNKLNINYNNNSVYKNHNINKGILNQCIYVNKSSTDYSKQYNNSYYILSSVNLFKDKPQNSLLEIRKNHIYGYDLDNYNIKMAVRNDNFGIHSFVLNNYIINFLLSNNLIYSSYDLNYYSSYNYHINKYNYYPILNNYPSKYLNNKFFNIVKNSKITTSDLIYNVNNNIPLEDELKSCISDIKTNKNDILYLYEIVLDSYIVKYEDDYVYSNELLSYSYILFNSYTTNNYDTCVTNIVSSINSSTSKKKIFFDNLSSYINSTYMDLSNISDIASGHIGRTNLKNYITTYSNNFIKFI